MTLWFVFALMTAAAVFAVLWPLGRAGARRSGSEVVVYRDQIEEIARDRVSGLIGESEAEAARVEVSRRLLAAADAEARTGATAAAGASPRRRAAAIAALVGIPLVAAALYLELGSPQLPGQPLAARNTQPLQDQSLASLVAQVETHLARNPEDGRGWEVVAPVYMRVGRYDDAVKAWRNALRFNGDSAMREAELGEALAAAANGVVTADAKAAFEKAHALDAKNVKARFFLGIAAEQDGNGAGAAAIWREMLAEAPQGAPWVQIVRQALARVDPASASAPGPSAEEIAAAQQMKPEDRTAMIRGMVERLAARLKQDGADVDGWLRLVRAYMVLGDKERAREAVADARRALGDDADKIKRLDELVKGLGLES